MYNKNDVIAKKIERMEKLSEVTTQLEKLYSQISTLKDKKFEIKQKGKVSWEDRLYRLIELFHNVPCNVPLTATDILHMYVLEYPDDETITLRDIHTFTSEGQGNNYYDPYSNGQKKVAYPFTALIKNRRHGGRRYTYFVNKEIKG